MSSGRQADPSSPDATQRYTPVGVAHSWRRTDSQPWPGAAPGAGPAAAVVPNGTTDSCGTYLQPTRSKAAAAAAMLDRADGTWPPPPPPPPPLPKHAALPSRREAPSPAVDGVLLQPVSDSHADSGELRPDSQQESHYEEVSAEARHASLRLKDHCHSVDLAEPAIALPQKMPQNTGSKDSDLIGRKGTNPLYAASEKFSVKLNGCNFDEEKNYARPGKPCCTRSCACSTIAVLLSAAALALATLPLLGLKLNPAAEQPIYYAATRTEGTEAFDKDVARLEIMIKELREKATRLEAAANVTSTMAPVVMSLLARCRYYHYSATNSDTDWLPNHTAVANSTVIGASCYMRSGEEWYIETRTSGIEDKRQHRCICRGKSGMTYRCIMTYWLCPDK